MTQVVTRMPTGCDPDAWDAFWASDRGIGWRSRSRDVCLGLGPIFDDVSVVWEFGFGVPEFAELLGRERWRGVDVSPIAVWAACERGFNARIGSCGDADIGAGDGVCAFQVLSYLDEDERSAFLNSIATVAGAVVFTDAVQSYPIFRTGERFREYLSAWFPRVKVREVTVGRKTILLAVSQ